MQQKIEDIKRAGRPERPAQVTAKKETAFSPESTVSKREDHRQIITRLRRKEKREFYIKIGIIAAVLLVFAIVACAIIISKETTTAETPTRQQVEEGPTPEPTTEDPKLYGYFAYLTNDGEPQLIDMEYLAKAWAAEAGFEVRYPLTDAERYELAQIITAEAEGEPLAGKMAICQCLLQAAEDDEISPTEAAERYRYSTRRPEPTQEALTAVSYVFDFGIVVTSEPIKYFYNPDRVESSFHESQRYILTINNHRFFAEIKQ